MHLYNIAMASNLTGLSSQLIRSWEARYGLVCPQRNASNYRIYSEQDIQKLILLKELTESGLKVGLLARLSLKELAELHDKSNLSELTSFEGSRTEELLLAVANYDGDKFNELLQQEFIARGVMHLVFKVLIPLLTSVGKLWERGELGINQEHFCSSLLTRFLNGRMSTDRVNHQAPVCVISTPTNCLHELGGLMAATIAPSMGWNPLYLGANLPANELIASALSAKAKLVILSVIYNQDREQLRGYLNQLAPLGANGVNVVIGGDETIRSLSDFDFIEVSDSIEELPSILRLSS